MNDSRRAPALAFLAAFVALFAQVLVHRMVSAKLLNNFAFLVISLTMLGFAVSGVFLSRRLRAVLDDLDGYLLAGAAFFAISLVVAAILFYRAPSGDELLAQASAASARTALLSYVGTLPLALLFTVPFAFVGFMLGALLAAPTTDARRVYAFDLAGSAAGAYAVIPAISSVGVEGSLLAACAALVAGALLLTRPRTRRPRLAAAMSLAVVGGAALAGPRAFAMRYPLESFVGMTQVPSSGYVLERIAWDPVARIELLRIPPPPVEGSLWPSLTGRNPEFLARFKRVITQNNNAFTYAVDFDGGKESLRGIEETIYAAAYQASSVKDPKVLVIGVGGGFDVLTALFFDSAAVVGVEVNGATLDIVRRDEREYFRHWVEDPRVQLVYDEGRHFLARHDAAYDILQLSGVDSASGTPGAAHVFSESYIYTDEAFDLYLSRLAPGGILNVMRHEWIPPREMLRALCTAVGALRVRLRSAAMLWSISAGKKHSTRSASSSFG